MTQHRLRFPLGWGGRRKGSGRKPKGRRALNPRCRRKEFECDQPVHVTMRIAEGLPSLRQREAYRVILEALAASNGVGFMRVVHYSIQSNHVHLLVEADGQGRLTKGVQGFSIRMARALNKVWGRAGKVFGDRYFARALKTPREVRHAIRYVLENYKHHGGRPHDRNSEGADKYSSGYAFEDWCGSKRGKAARVQRVDLEGRLGNRLSYLVARTWLLGVGWTRARTP